MPKQKQPANQIIKSIEELISDYDRTTLIGALNSFKTNNLGWQLFKAMLMKEHLSQAAYVLEYSSKTGKQIEAAYHAGCSQTMYDTASSLIDKYIQLLENRSSVVENVRPQEE